MNVTQVLTLVSTTGEYGGPQAVADSHARGLRQLGHTVTTVAGRRPADQGPFSLDGRVVVAPARSPMRGVSGLLGVRLVRDLVREVRTSDVVHIHFARDLIPIVAASAALVVGRPYTVQTHGMVAPDRRRVVRVLDGVVTKPLMRRARSRMALHETEQASLDALLGGSSQVDILANAIPAPTSVRARSDGSEAIFMARLHPRKRVLDFVEAAKFVGDGSIRFRVVGPDAGDLGGLRAFIASNVDLAVEYEGFLPPELVRTRLSRASVCVLPSRDEPFPMVVLEALSVGLPCVVTRSCLIASLLEEQGAALVVPDGDPPAIAAAVRALIADPRRWTRASQAALLLAQGELSEATISRRLEELMTGRTPR